MPGSTPYSREIEVAVQAATQASAVILSFYSASDAATHMKADGSPVTDADIASDRRIREVIGLVFPDDAFLTEEGMQDLARLSAERCWIIDPIDGTKQFIARTGRFDVFIALVVDERPVLGVTVNPVSGVIHLAETGYGASVIRDGVRSPFRIAAPPSPPRLVSSQWFEGWTHETELAAIAARIGAPPPPVMEVGFQPRQFDPRWRSFDIFLGGWPQGPAESVAQEWDVAASDVIVNEAGGRLTRVSGELHRYNARPESGILGGLVASASPEQHDAVLAALRAENVVE